MKQNTLAVDYSDSQHRVLVEEYIIQQKSPLSLKGACDYVLYWSIEEGRSSAAGFLEGTSLQPNDQERIRPILKAIAQDRRIAPSSTEKIYERTKN